MWSERPTDGSPSNLQDNVQLVHLFSKMHYCSLRNAHMKLEEVML